MSPELCGFNRARKGGMLLVLTIILRIPLLLMPLIFFEEVFIFGAYMSREILTGMEGPTSQSTVPARVSGISFPPPVVHLMHWVGVGIQLISQLPAIMTETERQTWLSTGVARVSGISSPPGADH